MTASTAIRPTSYRPAVSRHALVMLPPADVPVASAPIPMPVPVPTQSVSPDDVTRSQWAPIPCHTILPARRFRLR